MGNTKSNDMKKIFVTGVLLIVLLAACKNEVPSAPVEPAPVDATPPPAIPERPKPEMPQEKEGTSVQIGPDGLSVENKDGDHKTDVKIKGDGKTSVDVRSPK